MPAEGPERVRVHCSPTLSTNPPQDLHDEATPFAVRCSQVVSRRHRLPSVPDSRLSRLASPRLRSHETLGTGLARSAPASCWAAENYGGQKWPVLAFLPGLLNIRPSYAVEMGVDRGHTEIPQKCEDRIETNPHDLAGILPGPEVAFNVVHTAMILCHHAMVKL